MRIDLCLRMGGRGGRVGRKKHVLGGSQVQGLKIPEIQRGEHHFPHCIDDKIEVQRARVSFPGPHS